MAEPGRPRLWTIPAHRAFADALAEGLLARHDGDRLALAHGVIVLPNNRAVQAVTEAFVRRADGGLLLPRMVPLGDPELDERLGALFDPADGDEDIPRAITPARRLFALARLIGRERMLAGRPVSPVEALRLARELARVRDQLLIEDIAPSRLATLEVAPELQRHWQSSLALLQIVLDKWPGELAAMGVTELADRRNRLLRLVARRWRTAPPPGFVTAAGITVTAPAVAGLLRAIAWLPHGEVVFPALDTGMSDEEWQMLGPFDRDPVTGRRPRAEETHPQYHLKLLLDRMGVARGEVRIWPRSGGEGAPATRSRAIRHVFAPPRLSDRWQTLPAAERNLGRIRALQFASPAGEAQTIAMLLREALETPGRRAALVTPDRALAQRVVAHLERWGVEADDSAGRPLVQTPPGRLLLAIADALAERLAPVALLSLLKHPLVEAGAGRQQWLDQARLLDLALRGPRPGPGLGGIAAHLDGGQRRERRVRAAAAQAWPGIAARLTAIDEAPDRWPLPSWLACLRETAAMLAGEAAWAGADGRMAADLLDELEQAADGFDQPVERQALPAVLAELLAGAAVRMPYRGHPRIAIYGLLEARLQKAERMILAGLNEGTWPALPAPDPWLAPRVRAELGLDSLERRIGLAAHDFASLLGAPEVIITRADRDSDGQPSVPSRFWLRLAALASGGSFADGRDPADGWARRLDGPDRVAPVARPAPCPPLAERPRTINVTDVDRLKADPFAFYAGRMLGLRTLQPVDADPGAAWKGTAAHEVLERWLIEDACDPAKLLPRAQAMLDAIDAHPMVRALWQPRLLSALEHFAALIAQNRDAGRVPALAEAEGRTVLSGITVLGRVDRIDVLADGSLAIVDYKTGKPPSKKAVRAGFAQQLGLIGLIAAGGGFDGVHGAPAAFEYWSLMRNKKGSSPFGVVISALGKKEGPEEFLAAAASAFDEVARRWLNGTEPFTAKLHPEHAPYRDHDQLMRLQEWYGRGGGDRQ